MLDAYLRALALLQGNQVDLAMEFTQYLIECQKSITICGLMAALCLANTFRRCPVAICLIENFNKVLRIELEQ